MKTSDLLGGANQPLCESPPYDLLKKNFGPFEFVAKSLVTFRNSGYPTVSNPEYIVQRLQESEEFYSEMGGEYYFIKGVFARPRIEFVGEREQANKALTFGNIKITERSVPGYLKIHLWAYNGETTGFKSFDKAILEVHSNNLTCRIRGKNAAFYKSGECIAVASLQ